MEFCSPNRASGPPTLTHLITHVWTLSNTPTHTHSSLPKPGAPDTLPDPEKPVMWALSRQEVGSRTRTLLTVRVQGGPEPAPQPGDWEDLGFPRAQGMPDSPDDPPHLYWPIPALLKHSHQAGYRRQSFLTRPLYPADLQGSPQLPLKQGGRSPASTLSHPHLGSQVGSSILGVPSLPRAQQTCSLLQREERGSGPRATALKGKGQGSRRGRSLLGPLPSHHGC